MVYKSLIVNPVGVIQQDTADKASPDETEFIVNSRKVQRNEFHLNTSGTSQTVSSTVFSPLQVAGVAAFDIASGTSAFTVSAAGAGDNMSWTGFKSTGAIISYSFRCALPGTLGAKVVQVCHQLSGSGNGNAPTGPSEIAQPYFRMKNHHVSSSLNSNWIADSFIVPVDSRMRTSGSYISLACDGTATITSASIQIQEL